MRVTNPDRQVSANTAADDYTYIAPPVLSSLTPGTAGNTGGDVITITGTGFNDTETYTVTVGTNTPVAATYISPTQISFIAPAGLLGTTSSVYATSSVGGQSNTLVDALTYVIPNQL